METGRGKEDDDEDGPRSEETRETEIGARGGEGGVQYSPNRMVAGHLRGLF